MGSDRKKRLKAGGMELERGRNMNPGRTVLITGVGKGLGKALALELATRGHTIIGCSRSQDNIDSLQLQLASFPNRNRNHLFFNADIRFNESVRQVAEVVMDKNAVPDIIVNNAGTINKNNKLWEVPAEEFEEVMDTNVKGTANVLRHFIPLMIEEKNGEGIIVNMSSGWASARVVGS